jgi:nitronate monooxygenase
MSLPPLLQGLALPVVAAPMLILSSPALVLAQCKAGIVGSFPALNARPAEQLGDWILEIREALESHRRRHPGATIGPFAINQIMHPSNARLERDVRVALDAKVPVWLTSLRAPPREILDEIHAYGGIVLHDVVSHRHAMKALEAGVDGLVLVAAGAGGHAGRLSPFALVGELRRVYDGPLVLSGSIAAGAAILAARALGADLAYIGTRFIASSEANASEDYKRMIVGSRAADIVYTDAFTGVHGNYLRDSIVRCGLDPDRLELQDGARLDFSETGAKAWRDLWAAGQGVGLIDDAPPVGEIVARLRDEYHAALQGLQG